MTNKVAECTLANELINNLKMESKKMKQSASVMLSITFLLLLSPSHAVASDISLHGFLEGNYSLAIASKNPDGGDFKWANEWLQLRLDASKEPFRLFLRTDAFYDHIDDRGDVELREGYLDYTAGQWDVRIGRQVITWGVGDLLFINDTYPKDFEAFFSGRPLEYLKRGVDAVKVGIYPGFASFELVLMPSFNADRLPDPGRFHMFDPFPGINREKEKPAKNLENTAIALRAFRDVAGFDTSLYFYRGFFRQPSIMPDNPAIPTRVSLFFPELSVYGASAQGRALEGILSLEAAYYDSRQDRRGADSMITNSRTKFLIGYQRQLWEDFTVGLQYYGEYMHDYSEYARNLPPGFPKEKRLQDLVTVRLTQFLKHQTLRLSFFSFYSPSDGDYFLNPEIKYSFTDHIWGAIGGIIFGGSEARFQFGQFDRNDNLYIQVRYEF